MQIGNCNVIHLLTCLDLSFVLFSLGIGGVIWNKRNLLVMLLCIEIMFFALSLNFIFFSVYTHTTSGQVFALLIITAAASETAIGLSLLTLAYRLSNKVAYNSLITLRG